VAPICSKVVVALRCCSGGDSEAMVVRCLRSPMEVLLSCVAMDGGSNKLCCSLHLVRCSRWRDDGGP